MWWLTGGGGSGGGGGGGGGGGDMGDGEVCSWYEKRYVIYQWVRVDASLALGDQNVSITSRPPSRGPPARPSAVTHIYIQTGGTGTWRRPLTITRLIADHITT